MKRYVQAVKQLFTKKRTTDFEALGYQTRLECQNIDQAREICACHIQAHAEQCRAQSDALNVEIDQVKHQGGALRARLYDRPVPVNDAAMLARRIRERIQLVMILITGLACLAGGAVTFYLFGFHVVGILLAAAGITAAPVAIGHFFYEQVLVRYQALQTLIVLASVVLCFAGLFELNQARLQMAGKVSAEPNSSSYVDGAASSAPPDPAPAPTGTSEQAIRETLAKAMFLITMAAEFVLGLLVARYTRLREDEDYVSWLKLHELAEVIAALQAAVSELLASIEIAKKYCAAGILRAENVFRNRKTPYHRALVALLVLFLFLYPVRSQAQHIEHYDAILIDTSASIGRGPSRELFHDYLAATKDLLLTEPPNARIWVSVIASDSFGGSQDILRGWTPDARGVFTDNLNRARHELVATFENKASGLSPVAGSTDIFGALWHVKTVFESKADGDRQVSKTIYIFSDMMNETQTFPMPTVLQVGPEQMLERAKANGLVVPFAGYKVYVQGASPAGLTPQAWGTIKRFWELYFAAAGAELVTYSADCRLQRSTD